MAMHLFRDWNRELDTIRPTQLLDQHFGMGMHPEQMMLAPFSFHHGRPALHRPYHRQWRMPCQEVGSTVHCTKDKFQVNLDVQQFAPEEITVKVVDNCLTVEGKHEEKEDEHGYIQRSFKRRYALPEGHDMNAIASSLSSDGVLSITAPKSAPVEKEERVISITPTGPHKHIELEKKTEKKTEKKVDAKKVEVKK